MLIGSNVILIIYVAVGVNGQLTNLAPQTMGVYESYEACSKVGEDLSAASALNYVMTYDCIDESNGEKEKK